MGKEREELMRSAFASSAGWGKGFELEPKHKGNGLTDLGRELVREMNRLGSESAAYLLDYLFLCDKSCCVLASTFDPALFALLALSAISTSTSN